MSHHLGVEGGFLTDEKHIEFEDKTSIVLLPHWLEVPFPNEKIPEKVNRF